jgi:hypothetical protein
VNGSSVVYQSAGSSASGNFAIYPGDSVAATLSGTSGNYSQSELFLNEGATPVANDLDCGPSDSSASIATYYLGANGTIIAIVSNDVGSCE